MINFYLPDFYYIYPINICLINLLKNEPEKFYPNIKIAAIYGCFPNQIWNGGRAVIGVSADIDNIIATIRNINDLGIPIRFTYTNSLLTEEHLSNTYCNFVTECANNGMNEILVNSLLLEEYLREKFPNFKYISSATRCIRDVNELNKLIDSKKYYLVLGDYRDNFNFDFLSKIKQKDKLEILIDPWCDPNCKIREYHYKVLNQMQLGIKQDEYSLCKWETASWQEVFNAGHVIKIEDLYNKYVDMGFNNFKLEGRNLHPINIIDSYVYYLVKPEYRDEIRNRLVREQYSNKQ